MKKRIIKSILSAVLCIGMLSVQDVAGMANDEDSSVICDNVKAEESEEKIDANNACIISRNHKSRSQDIDGTRKIKIIVVTEKKNNH